MKFFDKRTVYGNVERLAVDLLGAFKKVDDEFAGVQTFTELHVEPTKPVHGKVYFADGSDWDPGQGRGYYGYDADNLEYIFLGGNPYTYTSTSGNVTASGNSLIRATAALTVTLDATPFNGQLVGVYHDASDGVEVSVTDGSATDVINVNGTLVWYEYFSDLAKWVP